MPARLSISSSMKDLTSFSIEPSSGVHVWNREDNSPQLSSSSTIVSAVASASASAMLHPGRPGGTLRSQVLQKVGRNLKQSQQRGGGSGDASKLREIQGRSLQKSPSCQ